ncbi:MAG: hypothetical protein Q8O40_15030, partial [Chloroflexota bacterium]|nr:hypothetical protein [Chloroflexota bacterium]
RLPLISAVRIADRYDANRMAKVDEGGSLQVADQRLQFERNDKAAAGSLKVSQQGPVAVGNFPPVQSVAGTVNVSNLPTTQDVRVTNSSLPVSGSVNVSNLPSTQQVQGTVNLGNLPAVQDARIVNASVPVSGTVNVANLPPVELVGRTLLPMAVREASGRGRFVSEVQSNFSGKGVSLFLEFTDVSPVLLSPCPPLSACGYSIKVCVDGIDPASGAPHQLTCFPSPSGVDRFHYILYPMAVNPEGTNTFARQMPLPATWRVSVVHDVWGFAEGSSMSWTFSLGASLLN